MTSDARPQVRLLRGFELCVDGRPLPLATAVQRLTTFLALRDRSLLRTYVAEGLWPDALSARAHANLRSSLWRLHQACPGIVEASSQHVRLAPMVAVDVRVAVNRARRLLDPSTLCTSEELDAATYIDFSGDLLPDWYDEWVVAEREQFRQLRLHALEALSERLRAMRRYGEAIVAASSAVSAEPLRETAHGALIAAHLAEGNRWEAMHQYRVCRRLLREELGVEPSPQLRGLMGEQRQRQSDDVETGVWDDALAIPAATADLRLPPLERP